jgi:hypothetical protein
MDLLVPETVQKSAQCHCSHFSDLKWEKYTTEIDHLEFRTQKPTTICNFANLHPCQLLAKWLSCFVTTLCQKNGIQTE